MKNQGQQANQEKNLEGLGYRKVADGLWHHDNGTWVERNDRTGVYRWNADGFKCGSRNFKVVANMVSFITKQAQG